MSLSVQNLQVSRGGVPVLSGVSFDVAAGQALILRGPNGIGKTSLLRCLAGLQPADEGQIICDEDSVAYASHADAVKSQLSVAENLEFWAEIYGAKVSDDTLDVFEIKPLKLRIAGTLSAGQKRRLGLARLGVVNRPIWLLDEPTVSLDAFTVKRFAAFLQDQHLSQGGCAVIATHVDLGFEAPTLDLEPYAASQDAIGSDEAFL